LNYVPHISTGFSPYEILYGRKPPNPLDAVTSGLLPQRAPLSREEIHAKVRENLRHHANLRQRNQKGETTVLELDDWVLLKNKVTSDTRTHIRQVRAIVSGTVQNNRQTASKHVPDRRSSIKRNKKGVQHDQLEILPPPRRINPQEVPAALFQGTSIVLSAPTLPMSLWDIQEVVGLASKETWGQRLLSGGGPKPCSGMLRETTGTVLSLVICR
jgi:hypothetical protein